MGNITTGLVIVLCVSVVLVLGGIVASDIAGTDKTILSCNSTMLNQFGSGCNNVYILNTTNAGSQLPGASPSVAPTGNFVVDTYTSIMAWIGEKTGATYLYNVLSAPSTWLKNIGVPSIYADIIASIWYILCLFLLISWLRFPGI